MPPLSYLVFGDILHYFARRGFVYIRVRPGAILLLTARHRSVPSNRPDRTECLQAALYPFHEGRHFIHSIKSNHFRCFLTEDTFDLRFERDFFGSSEEYVFPAHRNRKFFFVTRWNVFHATGCCFDNTLGVNTCYGTLTNINTYDNNMFMC